MIIHPMRFTTWNDAYGASHIGNTFHHNHNLFFTHQYVKDHTCKYTIALNILTHISRDVAREGFEPPTFRL